MVEIENLNLTLNGFSILEDLSFYANSGEVTAIVGASGSGKSMLLKSIIGLLPDGAEARGTISYKGRNLLALSYKEREAMRGRDIALMGQNPISSFNPFYKIGHQLRMILKANAKDDSSIPSMMKALSLDERVLREYPSRLSGGTLQRLSLMLTLALKAELTLLDEAANALDSTLEYVAYDYIREHVRTNNTTMIVVSHNLRSTAYLADRIALLDSGSIAEEATAMEFYKNPQQPASKRLLESLYYENSKHLHNS